MLFAKGEAKVFQLEKSDVMREGSPPVKNGVIEYCRHIRYLRHVDKVQVALRTIKIYCLFNQRL